MSDRADRLRSALSQQYVLESEIGAGGMATVYLAIDIKHGRKVALKVMRPEFSAAVGRDRFGREIEILSHLRHPHILPLLDSGAVDDLCWFAMPYCEGESLRERLDRERQLSIDQTLQFACEVADALAYAHAHGVIHRDIKPQNIMLESGHAVLADFGIALATDGADTERLTSTGHSLGTPHYMSPEQASSGHRIDARSDIYSLGCVLYEMLVGEPPFTGPNLLAIVARHAVEPPRSIRVVRDTVSEAFERVVFRSLAKAPADRYQTGAELIEALTEARNERVRETGAAGARVRTEDERRGVPAPPQPAPSPSSLSPTQLLLRGAIGLGSVALLLTVIGYLSVTAFDVKLQVPARFAPSRTDFLVMGARALLPMAVYGVVAVAVFVVARYVTRLAVSAFASVSRVGKQIDATGERLRSRWYRLWQSVRPRTVADSFLFAVVLSSALVLAAFWSALTPIFTADVDRLNCANRVQLRPFMFGTSVLMVGLGFAWFRIFSWLDRRPGDHAGSGLARWGSVAVITLMLIIVGLPWRTVWAEGNERVRIGADRGYLIVETENDLVVYNADRHATTVYENRATAGLERLGIQGYVFEEPSAFESGLVGCASVNSPTTGGRP